MARRGSAVIKKIAEDAVYKSVLVAKLINRAMRDGKKSVATKQVYKAFDIVKEKSGGEALATFNKALDNIRPSMEVRARRIGGAAYQVPVQVRGTRKDSLAIRWLVSVSNAKPNSEFRTFAEKLSSEIILAANGEGATVKKRKDMEIQAESNKAFSHFKW